MFAWFVVRSGPNAGQQHSVAGEQAVLGRAPQCQIVLADQRASRQHAQVRSQDGTWIIEDLGSTNGTFLNGQRLEPRAPRVLHPGDEVQLADTILTFQVEQEEMAVSSSGLPYLASTGTASRRRLHPLVLVMAAAAMALLLGLVALVVVLLTSTSESAGTLPTATQTEAAVAPVPTAEPSASQPLPESTPVVDLSQTTPLPKVQAPPEDTALSKEALAWLKSLEGKLFVASELILKFKAGVSDQEAQAFLAEQGLQEKDEIQALGLRLVSVEEGSASEALAGLVDHPLLAFVDLNAVFRGLSEPNDAHWSRQWNMPIIEAPQGWDLSTGSGEVIVAIIDSGIDLNHPDLRDKIVAGYDFVEDDATPQDDYGHGTHVAGIAAAFGNNGEGVAGVSWGSRIMPVRVLGAQNQGSDFGVIEGMVWATDQGARVMNLSLGSPMPGMLANHGIPGGDALREAVNYAHSHNVLVVAASGNEYEKGNPPSYPAAYAHVLAVSATNDEDGHAYYSSAGSYVDVAAPGGETSGPDDPHGVFSTLPNYEVEITRSGLPTGYGALQGTSMAAPHVAGLAALVWSVSPGLSNDQVQAIIEGTADDRGAPGWDGCFGTGRINANQALQAASAGRIPPGGPREHGGATPSFCADFTVVPEATFVIPAPTIEWSWGP